MTGAVEIAGLDDIITSHCLRLPQHVRIRKFGLGSRSSRCKKAEEATELLQRLAHQYRGDFEQCLIATYTGYISDGRFRILKTSQYKSTNGVTEMGIFARSTISTGQIQHLGGIRVPQAAAEEELFAHPDLNFSNGVSQRTGVSYFIVGPARFLNHDCDSNASLIPWGCSGISVAAKRRIHPGEEITVSYGKKFFGEGCQCRSCKGDCRSGGRANRKQRMEALNQEQRPYNLRKRRDGNRKPHTLGPRSRSKRRLAAEL